MTWTLPRTILMIACVTFAAIVIDRYVNPGDRELRALVGKPAVDFTLPLHEGGEFHLASKRGNVVVLDFWASWCLPCAAAMPFVEQTTERYADRGVQLYTVNVSDTPDLISQFKATVPTKSPTIMAAGSEVDRAYKVRYIPQLVVIDRKGVIRAAASVGPVEIDAWLSAAIESALKTGEASPP